MEKEFNLSEKIYEGAIQTPYIKEFIKKLKEEMLNEGYKETAEHISGIIDKLAGDELI